MVVSLSVVNVSVVKFVSDWLLLLVLRMFCVMISVVV